MRSPGQLAVVDDAVAWIVVLCNIVWSVVMSMSTSTVDVVHVGDISDIGDGAPILVGIFF